MDLGAYWYQSLALVFKLDVDDLDRWENPLLVCVAGPRYHIKPLNLNGFRGFLFVAGIVGELAQEWCNEGLELAAATAKTSALD